MNKSNIRWGTFVILLQILVLFRYFKSGCIDMPQVPIRCGDDATWYLYGVILFLLGGVFMVISGITKLKKEKNK